ncbi:hypothetical protein Nos7107_3913 [Nostoc sp. PCC 7107]|nr:hypothetical protein Nos7107_3913 [Nostoc sp. PCC 7107]
MFLNAEGRRVKHKVEAARSWGGFPHERLPTQREVAWRETLQANFGGVA